MCGIYGKRLELSTGQESHGGILFMLWITQTYFKLWALGSQENIWRIQIM